MTILLQSATAMRYLEVVELLLKEGADTNSPDLPHPPLLVSVKDATHRRGVDEAVIRVIKTLLDYGADVHGSRETVREPDGRLKPQFQKTPLICAILCRSSELVRLLIRNGADINHREITPLQLARYIGEQKVEHLLLRHEATESGAPACSIANYVNELRIDGDDKMEKGESEMMGRESSNDKMALEDEDSSSFKLPDEDNEELLNEQSSPSSSESSDDS